MKRVLISAPYMQLEFSKLENIFKEKNVYTFLPQILEKISEEELLDIIGDFDGVIAGDDPFTYRVFEKAKRLKVVSKWGTGINSIDLEAARHFNVKICNTPNAFSHPVADTALAFMLSFARRIIDTDIQMKKGIWDKIPGHTLSEMTLGIIGLGNIGSQVAKRANAFNMKILANDVREIHPLIIEQYNISMVSKDEIYENANYISIHCDLNDESYHLLNREAFKQMKNKPYIINTARGGHIAQNDLLEALEAGLVSGAGLDVFEDEPIEKGNPILLRSDVILAPHNSNNSPKYWDIVHRNTIKNLFKYLEA